jgi:hypothetical protein
MGFLMNFPYFAKGTDIRKTSSPLLPQLPPAYLRISKRNDLELEIYIVAPSGRHEELEDGSL